jgi:hypothetical protein
MYRCGLLNDTPKYGMPSICVDAQRMCLMLYYKTRLHRVGSGIGLVPDLASSHLALKARLPSNKFSQIK